MGAADRASACFYRCTRWRGVVGSAGLKALDSGGFSGKVYSFSFSSYLWLSSFVSDLWRGIPTLLHHLGTSYLKKNFINFYCSVVALQGC